jgi:hypothetical protein
MTTTLQVHPNTIPRNNAGTVRRMRQDTLEAKMEFYGIEQVEVSREIDSPFTVTKRKNQAIEQRDKLVAQVARIQADLDALGEMAAHEELTR